MTDKKCKSSSGTVKLSFSADKKKSRKMKKNAAQEVNFLEEYKNDPKYKTELCRTFAESGTCVYGNKCRFAHGKEELFEKTVNHPKYKQKNCLSYFQNGYCIYGSCCHFKHNEKKIDETQRTFYTYLLNLIELNLNDKIKNQSGCFFDEDDDSSLNIDQYKSTNSSVSNETTKNDSVVLELIEEKIKQKFRRLPVFSQIAIEENCLPSEKL
jgi:hypothetical protein